MAFAVTSAVVLPAHTVASRPRAGVAAAATAPKAAAMSGLHTAAPSFLGGARPTQLSPGIAADRRASGAGSRGVATMGLFGLGLPELVVIGGVAAVLFGPSKLPELGKSLGKTVKSFQGAATEFQDELKAGKEEEAAAEVKEAEAVKAVEGEKKEEKKEE